MFAKDKHRARKSPLQRVVRGALAALLCTGVVSVPATVPASAEGGGTTSPAVPADAVAELYVTVGAEGDHSSARCGDGDFVVNGGWAASHAEHSLVQSWPALDARGWEIGTEHPGNGYAYAVCARMASPWRVYTASALIGGTSPAHSCQDPETGETHICGGESVSADGTASCESGDRAIGGGWQTISHESLIASHPSGPWGPDASAIAPATGWTASARAGGVRALCTQADGPFGDVQVVKVATPSGLFPGGHHIGRSDCPSGTAVIGGGYEASHTTVIRNHPRPPSTWVVEQSSVEKAGTSTYALCMPLGRGFSAAMVTPVVHVPDGGGVAAAACREGFRVFGGGVSLDPHPTILNSGLWHNAPDPDGASWSMVAHHTGEVHGICLRLARSTATVLRVETTPAYEGEPVSLVAAIGAAAGRPGGRVSFRDGSTLLGSTTVNPDGEAWLHPSTMPPGTRALTARYEGDGTFSASTSAPVTLHVRPRRVETAVTLVSSSTPAPRGNPVTLTARVTPTPAGSAPSGTVEFRDGGVPVGTATVSGGLAVLAHTFSEQDFHVLQAVYSGDDAHRGSGGWLTLLVTTLLTVDDVTIVESDAAPATGLLRLRLSEALDTDLPVHFAVDSVAADLFADGVAPAWHTVIPAGQTEMTIPVTVAAQLQQHDRGFDIHVDVGGDGAHLTRNAVRGTVDVTHPSCTIAGTAGDDHLRGSAGDDVICVLGGDDHVDGANGDDVILGGDGHDELLGGPGDDRIVGGRGDDRLTAGAGAGHLHSVDGVSGNDRLVGGRDGSCESDAADIRIRC